MLVLLSVSLAVNSQSASAIQVLAKPDFAKFERILLKEMKEQHVPGVSVVLIKGDTIVYSKAFGVKSTETNDRVTPETFFRIASTTKMFTAAAVVKAFEERSLDLKGPIGNHVRGLEENIGRLTVHQLLTHTAGLLDASSDEGPQDEAAAPEWSKSLGPKDFFTTPGDTYSYANPGFQLAGAVLAGVMRKPYADAMQTEIFDPLGMRKTTFRPTTAMTYDLAVGHEYDAETKSYHVARPMPNSTPRWPAGNMYSNTGELAKFCIAIMNGGKLMGKQVLSSSVVEKLLRPNPETQIGPTSRWYGYGLNIVDWRGIRLAQHAGGSTGYGSLIRIVPEQKIAYVLLANASLAILPKTNDAAIEAFLKLSPEPAAPKAIPFNPEDLARYPGKYQNGGLQFEIVARDGGLLLKVSPEEEFKLTKLGDNLLSLKSGNPALEGTILSVDLPFTTGSDGRPKYLHFVGRALKRL